MISQILKVLSGTLDYLIQTFAANWFILLLGILIAVLISVYVDAEKTHKLFLRRPRFLILGSVLFGAFTPLCACGTMAVVLSLISSTIPLGAIMAFLVSSPLMSPDTFVVLSGFLGLKFAIALAISSIILGLGAGWITHVIESRTNFLNDQLRLNCKPKESDVSIQSNENIGIYVKSSKQKVDMVKLSVVSLSVSVNSKTTCCSVNPDGICCEKESVEVKSGYSLTDFFKGINKTFKLKKLMVNFFDLGIVKILPLFVLFVVIAYLVKEYVPTLWIVKLFSGEHIYSIPLAALIGLPMYVSDATVVPLLQVLRDTGASDGAILAYMISGPATSLGVIGGLSVIMKRKEIFLYIIIILIGAITLGYVYDLILPLM